MPLTWWALARSTTGRSRSPHRGFIALALCAVLGACAPADDAQPTTTEADAPDLGASTTEAGAAPEPQNETTPIPAVPVERLADVPGPWRSVRAEDGRIYAFQRTPAGTYILGRFDPTTGALLTSRELPRWSSYTLAPEGVVLLYVEGHRVDVLGLDDLATLRSIDIPEGQPDLNADTPRRGPFWIGYRRTGEAQLAGRATPMALLRLDLAAGTVAERREATPCGAKSAAQIDDQRLAYVIECAYQPAVLDLTTGEEQALDGFPDGAHAYAIDGTAWFRWKTLGFVARIRDDRLETLDLNADGPLLANLNAFAVVGDSVLLTGEPADPGAEPVLYRLDRRTFRVAARTRVPDKVVGFTGGAGYVATEGGLLRFDLDDVSGGAPSTVTRPDPGVPAGATASSADEAAVIDTMAAVFDPDVPAAQAGPLLEDPALIPLREQITAFARVAYPDVDVRVTAVTVDGDGAAVVYLLTREGRSAFVPLSATLVRRDGRWLVTRDAVCQVFEAAAFPGC